MNYQQIEAAHTSGVYGKRPFTIVRGQGATVWDDQDRSYIDCGAGIGVANVGHCHPDLIAAITKQANTLINCPEMFYNDQRARFLTALSAELPGNPERIFLCNSGTEAVEAAIKFARQATGKTQILSTARGFHGRTMGALSATHNKKYRHQFMPLVPGFNHVPFNNIEAIEGAVNEETAAVIVEIIQGEGGVNPGSPAYFQALQQICNERNIMLIVDEVQTGYGRTGKMFACEHMNIQPDFICLGKAMAGGVPMGAVGIGSRVPKIPNGSHGSTFGGNPVACAAGQAVLDIMKEEELVQHAADLGDFLIQELQNIQSPLIREVRGLGLMVGVEMRQRVMPIAAQLMEQGVITLNAGPTVLRLLPPLVIKRTALETVLIEIKHVLNNQELG